MIFNLMNEWIPLPHYAEQCVRELAGKSGSNPVFSVNTDEVSKL